MTSNTIAKPYSHNGHTINIQFTADAFFNATAAAKAFGKSPKDWLKTEETKEYILAIRRKILVEENQLVKVVNGAPSNGGGTWIHPKLGVHFARWLNADFAVWADEQIAMILTGTVSTAIPMVRDLKIRDLAYCVRAFSASRDLWSKQMMLYAIKRLCGELSLPMPPAYLLGKPVEQHQLEI